MAENETPTKQKDPTYTAQELASEGFLPEFRPYEVIGALSGERRENFTVDQARPIVEKWLKREVVVEQAEPDGDEEE